jgi:D-alanyl-D-alanine carboxypeptidase
MKKFNNKFSVSFLLTFLLSTTLFAQIFDDLLSSNLQNQLDKVRSESQFMGMSAAIISDEHGLWTGTSGFSQESSNKVITSDMIFGIGSVTKTYITTLVMQLEDEGILSINDSLYQWLPSYPNIDSTTTIKQLLKHESGIFNLTESPLFFEIIDQNPLHVWQDEEIILNLVDQPLFKPGAAYSYSNTNFILLGMILKKATAKSISTLLKERILIPLKLNDTFLAIEDSLEGNIAHGWLDVDGDAKLDDLTEILPRNAFYSAVWTSAAIFSTAENTAVFMKALFNGELVSANSLNKMMDINATTHSGLGVFGFVTPENISMMGHDGFTLEYSAFVYYDVTTKSTFSVLINQRDLNGSHSMMLIFEFIKILSEFVPTSVTSEPLAQKSFQLDQNWPNPFNSSTNISFTLQKAGTVQLNIYNVQGGKIKTVVIGNRNRGNHTFTWNGENDAGSLVSSGTYIYQFKNGHHTETKRMILIR